MSHSVFLQLSRKLGLKHNHQLNITLFECLFNFTISMQVSVEPEISGGSYFLGDLSGGFIFRLIEDRNPGILNLIGDYIPKENQLHSRHPKENQQGAIIPEDMEKLFDYKSPESLHATSSFWARASFKKTSFIFLA